jgi:galactose mutarotase-like enzyme
VNNYRQNVSGNNEEEWSLDRQTLQGSFDAFVLDNDVLRLTIVPQLGGKIVSLVRLESGYEYLLQPPEPERTYRTRSYGDRFEDYETSGFDECTPTVAECLYPEEPFLRNRLPDHGDIWCLPSAVAIAGEQICLSTHLRSLPLRFTKKVQLQENTVILEYEATNLSQSNVKFLWSAHPLLRVEPDAEIVLPKEVKEVEVGWSKEERLGKSGDRCAWPKAIERSGRMVHLNQVLAPIAGTADKLFTPRLSEGFCGMFLPRAEEGITFRFDPRLVPFVGIWICQGGWPTSRATKHFTIALEPCLGRPDSLEEAVKRNECAVLRGGESIQWWMEIETNGAALRDLGGRT